ncbi:DUF3298 and DUF4163 domain-containing protein [Desulfotomaculum copahuensis]|uniref:DUF3298 domain-containing protein n=1 Tax=Desulfotomaculum copahuensis TaxID=1838280 RepID=A0A1B7LAM9_9FIRM|nr:DUF3298 and DUF4163 domain-containing protein [Desulfotomaculum copahuensis]OAT79385.1 hypothetical protein A6M21_01195 [Desulfotomaculum copahuensis]
MRKTILAAILVAVLCLTAAGCSGQQLENRSADNTVAPVTITAQEIKQDKTNIAVNLKIPVISGMKDRTVQNKINAQLAEDAKKFASEVEKLADAEVPQIRKSGSKVNRYTARTSYEVAYNKNGLLSITCMFMQYTGGAHGLEVKKAYNFDLTNGKNLALGDLFKPGTDYKGIINAEIKKQIQAKPGEYFSGANGFQGIKDNQGYYLSDNALVIYFQEYDIAPYAAGHPEFKIPYTLFGNGLKTP